MRKGSQLTFRLEKTHFCPNSEQVESRRRRKKGLTHSLRSLVVRLGYSGAVIVLAALMAAGAIYGGYKLLRDFRAQQMASGARDYLAQGKVREALLRAQSALTLTPEGPEAWRSMAAVMDAIGNPLALGCYEKIVSLGAATPEDRQNYLQAALKLGQTAAAQQQAAELEKSGDAGFARLVAAQEMMKRGNLAAAESALREIPGESAVSRSSKLLLAQLLAAQQGGEDKSEALALVQELSTGEDATAANALAFALTSGILPPTDQEEWLRRLENHPGADDRAFLVAKSARIATNASIRDSSVAEVMERFSPLPVERKTVAVVWLNQLGRYDDSLRLISSQEAAGSPDAYVAWLDTLAGKGDWARVESALSGDRVPLRGASLDMFRARAARMLGKDGAARQFYRQAANNSLKADPREIAAVMSFLESEGQLPVLRESFLLALAEPATADAAKQALFAIEKQSRNAEKMREIAVRIRDALPDDSEARSAAVYYDLVLGGRGLTDEAWRMREAEPENFACRAVHALALLEEGFPDKAVRVFDGLSVRSDRITPEQKAILVCVLAANNRMDQAQAMASTLDPAALTLQEVELIARYFGPNDQPGE
jgi:tetratricopeptide (TPR) repeat protein